MILVFSFSFFHAIDAIIWVLMILVGSVYQCAGIRVAHVPFNVGKHFFCKPPSLFYVAQVTHRLILVYIVVVVVGCRCVYVWGRVVCVVCVCVCVCECSTWLTFPLHDHGQSARIL